MIGTRSVVSVFAERNMDAEEAESLADLPSDGTRLSKVRRVALDDRTAKANVLRGQFFDCFGCAGVSLTSCGLVSSNYVPAANGRVLGVPIILVATIAAEHIAGTMKTHQDGPLSRDFHRSIPMMFYQALDAVLPRFREIFAQFDITQPQWRVLRVLWDEDGQNLTSIAERTRIVPTVLVGIIDRLERDGRVERRRSKQDRRRVHIFLTESGHALRDDVAPLVDEAYVQLQAVLSAQEWRDLYSAIDKLIESDAAAKSSST